MKNFSQLLNEFCADMLKDRRKQAAEENRQRKLAERTPKSARNLAKAARKAERRNPSEQEIQSRLEAGW